MKRDQNFQKVAWFWDHYRRGTLELNPPYQRRSVWNQDFKDYFIDTVLLGYPSPAIFLFEETKPDGATRYNVVDGKQRLTTLFAFINGEFPVGDSAERNALRGKYFSEFGDSEKIDVWGYRFSVETLPTADEKTINSIFDRINRNVARLSHQELRHARFAGIFIKTAEELTDFTEEVLPQDFPRIAPQSKRQMKDVEFTAELLLFLELGPKRHSQDDLDEAFSARESVWDGRHAIEQRYRAAIAAIQAIVTSAGGTRLTRTRLKNQADFYSLFGAIDALLRSSQLPAAAISAERLGAFLDVVEDDVARESLEVARSYYDAARSASNDVGQRNKRIEIVKSVLLGG